MTYADNTMITPTFAASLWTGLIFIALLVVFLTGCATAVPTLVTKIETIYVTVPESMTRHVTPERPMARDEYLALNIHLRERQMALYSIGLLKTIGQCNAQLTAIENVQGRAP